MKTIFRTNRNAEILESLKRYLFNLELAFICLALPALFLIGIRGNDHSTVKQSQGYEEIYQAPQSQSTQSVVNLNPAMTGENS